MSILKNLLRKLIFDVMSDEKEPQWRKVSAIDDPLNYKLQFRAMFGRIMDDPVTALLWDIHCLGCEAIWKKRRTPKPYTFDIGLHFAGFDEERSLEECEKELVGKRAELNELVFEGIVSGDPNKLRNIYTKFEKLVKKNEEVFESYEDSDSTLEERAIDYLSYCKFHKEEPTHEGLRSWVMKDEGCSEEQFRRLKERLKLTNLPRKPRGKSEI